MADVKQVEAAIAKDDGIALFPMSFQQRYQVVGITKELFETVHQVIFLWLAWVKVCAV